MDPRWSQPQVEGWSHVTLETSYLDWSTPTDGMWEQSNLSSPTRLYLLRNVLPNKNCNHRLQQLVLPLYEHNVYIRISFFQPFRMN